MQDITTKTAPDHPARRRGGRRAGAGRPRLLGQKMQTYCICMPEDVHEKIAQDAAEKGITFSARIREILEEAAHLPAKPVVVRRRRSA